MFVSRIHCFFLMHNIVLIDYGKTTVVHLGFLCCIHWLDLRSLTRTCKFCGILVPLFWCSLWPLASNGQFTRSMMQLNHIKVCANIFLHTSSHRGYKATEVCFCRCIHVLQVFCRKSLFESVSCVSCASYFSILLTTDNGPFLLAKFHWTRTK